MNWLTSKDIQHKVARNLAEHGVVSADEGKSHVALTRRVYPEVNPQPEQELRQTHARGGTRRAG